MSHVVSGTKYHLSLSSMDVEKATKVLIAFAPEIDCDQITMGLLPVTSAVLLIAK
jgi:hypothetical protein